MLLWTFGQVMPHDDGRLKEWTGRHGSLLSKRPSMERMMHLMQLHPVDTTPALLLFVSLPRRDLVYSSKLEPCMRSLFSAQLSKLQLYDGIAGLVVVGAFFIAEHKVESESRIHLTGSLYLETTDPKSPCAYRMYTLALKQSLYKDFKAKVYTGYMDPYGDPD